MILSNKAICFLHSWLNDIKPNKNWKDGNKEQIERYKFAAQYAKGNVLDFGCGLGNGSVMLAEKADMVYAIDNNPMAIEFANALFPSEKVKYIKGNGIGGLTGLKLPKKFDTAICLEVLDHLKNPDAFIEQLKKKTTGEIIFSVCNSDAFGNIYDNIHHSKFDITNIKAFCEKHFEVYDLYYQIVGGRISDNPMCFPLYLIVIANRKGELVLIG